MSTYDWDNCCNDILLTVFNILDGVYMLKQGLDFIFNFLFIFKNIYLVWDGKNWWLTLLNWESRTEWYCHLKDIFSQQHFLFPCYIAKFTPLHFLGDSKKYMPWKQCTLSMHAYTDVPAVLMVATICCLFHRGCSSLLIFAQ